MSTDSAQQALSSLAGDMTCDECKRGLAGRVNDIIVKWALLKASKGSLVDVAHCIISGQYKDGVQKPALWWG